MRFKYKIDFLKSKGFSESPASKFLSIFVLAGLLLSSAVATSPQLTSAGLASIRENELREKVTYLASRELKGRGNGSPELRLAADYIAAVLQRNRIRPAGDSGTFFQNFRMFTPRLGTGNRFQVDGVEYVLGTDYVPHYLSVARNVEGALVFLGYGLSAPRLKYDEFVGINLRGKIAVVLDRHPHASDFRSVFSRVDLSDSASIQSKARNAARAGAVGLIVIQNPTISNIPIPESTAAFRSDYPRKDAPMGSMEAPTNPTIPVILTSERAGRRLVPSLRDVQRRIDSSLQAQVVDLGKRASLSVNVQRVPFTVQNVVGLIEGSDPNLRREVIIVGAHYDHDGEHDGQIWPGADDNASGTAGVLELAEAFGNGRRAPVRTILLCLFAGEEKGEIGSQHYTDNPFIPIVRTTAMLQMDMIGRNEEHGANRQLMLERETSAQNANTVNLIGTLFSSDLRKTMESANGQVGLDLKFRYDDTPEDLLRRSDQWPFLQKGIPSLFIHTGEHPDYHQPSDTADKINYAKMEKIVRLVFVAVESLGNASARPGFIGQSEARMDSERD
ncbi:MAG TPA: M28 family peptidase [Terriglobia bacterium]|nr:M28 family peptidase [Terriglobia bacterium]